MDIIQGLNDVQKQALLQVKGAVLVTAGAGSGKTRLLTHRLAYLIQNEHINENNILAITFTNKAANEMKERVSTLLGYKNGVWISTFHSMCLRILREHINKLEGYNSNFSVYSESDAEKALKQVIKDLNLPNDNYKHYAYVLSYCQNENIDIYTYAKRDLTEQEELIKVYETYEELLKKNNALDFDHLLTKTYELLTTNSDVLNYYANKFEYIFVDEFQDTNKVQYDLIKLLSNINKNVFVVGDEDQCIYTWRGANFQNIFNFKTDFAPVKIFKLEQNYRCTKNILQNANSLIKNNCERFDKVLWTDNEEGSDVECYNPYDEQAEADLVAAKILAIKNSLGCEYKDIAVLMRMNALTLPFEQKFLYYNIPYRIYGGFKFYERQEIKNIISYLRLFANPNDETALLRIINFPKRAIGDVAVDKLRQYSKEHNLSTLSGMIYLSEHKEDNSSLCSKIESFVSTYKTLKSLYETEKLDEFVKEVIDMFEIRSAYLEDSEENTDKLMNIDMFINSVNEYIQANPNSNLNEYLEAITLETDIDTMGQDNTVTISTVHSVKGLEFKVVFIIGMEEGIFPISRSYESDKELEEERRLMYVAITRAQKKLYVSYVSTRYYHGSRSPMLASRFLDEAKFNIPTKPRIFTSQNREYNFEHKSYSNNFTKPEISNSTKTGSYNVSNTFDSVKTSSKDISIYKVGQKVNHPKFGAGEIINIVDDGECADIVFSNFGKKTLILSLAPLEIIGE